MTIFFMLSDQYFIDNYFNKNDEISKAKIHWISKHEDELNYLKKRYSDSESIQETLWRIKLNIEIHPKCSCGNLVKYKGKGKYFEHCSRKCMKLDKSIQNKFENTCLKKYGVTSPAKSKEIQDKMKKTCIERFGVDNASKSELIKKKKEKTCIKNYNVKCGFLTEKSKKNCNSKEAKEKEYKTKKERNTFNTSKSENKLFNIIKEKYPDVISQYRSILYPYNCDFYIPSLNIYIELNEHWTHGKHPYDPNNKEDNIKLKKWFEKSKNSKFYKNAIKVWTVSDPIKRNIAKENNLNYIELWNLNDIKKINII